MTKDANETQPPNPARDRTEMPDEIWAGNGEIYRVWAPSEQWLKDVLAHNPTHYIRADRIPPQPDQPSDESRARALTDMPPFPQGEEIWHLMGDLQKWFLRHHVSIRSALTAQKPAAVDIAALKETLPKKIADQWHYQQSQRLASLATIDTIDYLAAHYDFTPKQPGGE